MTTNDDTPFFDVPFCRIEQEEVGDSPWDSNTPTAKSESLVSGPTGPSFSQVS